MDRKRSDELLLLCRRVSAVTKRLSVRLVPSGKELVFFNDPQHIFDHIEQYEQYADRDVGNVYDGIVKNEEGMLQPQCGYTGHSPYADIDKEPCFLRVPYQTGHIIEYYKKTEDGGRHRRFSYIICKDGEYQIFGEENACCEEIAIVVRKDEGAEMGGTDDEKQRQ